ncbi:ketopantoate reductase family protein [Pontibacter silvestris]|uniref:2-dehydropantoate 2-reductase n=1 Tax=Pontibacter silvestris TaxID=2305183 RepID=A0ABW4X1S0_9BACT|nr:2-dehydropantoate 2-reductase [Pontibacter silvestris]MCC9138890.1 2-dehydropantoate 2-reductase [Pontibacter silvestris]
MNSKLRIAVVGIGGVGGYYGGKLAQRYADSEDTEIIFIARGKHKEEIQTNGLTINVGSSKFTVKPDLVTDDVAGLGKLDIIVFCVKSYSLDKIAEDFRPSIDESTFLLPLQNGIESIEYLDKLYPAAKLLWGCVYIISSVGAPGVIEVKGEYNRLVWGNPELPVKELDRIHKLFTDAGIISELYSDIVVKVWNKFSFISPVATLTSAIGKTMGEIYENAELKENLRILMRELLAVAHAKGVEIEASIIDTNMKILGKLPKDATSSMQRDFMNNNQTELETLIGYIVREAQKSKVETPLFSKLYGQLKSK